MAETDGFAERYGPWALVAGASEGVGAALADQLAARGLHLVLLARQERLLEAVADGARRHGVEVRTLAQDLTAPDVGDSVAAATAGLDVGLVIYNAGAANRMPHFLDEPVEDSVRRVVLNCVGPVVLARLLGPAMRDRGRGGIVLVGSLSCLAGAARVAVYSATKAFGVNLAEGLWAELGPHGVHVCVAVLGAVSTPAAARMGVEPDPERDMEADVVAAEIVANIGNGPTYVVGEANREMAAAFWTVDRGQAATMISEATSAYADRLPTT